MRPRASMPPSAAASAGASTASRSTTSPPTPASRGRRSTACSRAARTCCSRRCGCASWRSSSPSCATASRAPIDDRGPARAHRRRRHPGAARRRAPGVDAGHRAGQRRSAQLTVEGVPRIIRFATTFLVPLAEPFLDRDQARARSSTCSPGSTISYFLAPSDTVDLGDEASARPFLTPLIRSTLTEGAIP